MSKLIESYLTKKLELHELGINSWMNDSTKVTVRTTDSHAAIGLLVSKLSIFEDVTYQMAVNFSSMPITEYSAYERAFYFAITNCNGQLREIVEETCVYMKDYSANFFEGIQRVNYL